MAMTNPFADLDVTKMMADFKVPGVDYESVVATQRKNIEALTQANQLVVEGMQAVARRQSEILRQTMDETSKAMQQMMEQSAPEAKLAKQTDLAKTAFDTALANMRELAELVTKSNRDAFDVINGRVAASLDELKTVMATAKAEMPKAAKTK
jgi:phasin family protein